MEKIITENKSKNKLSKNNYLEELDLLSEHYDFEKKFPFWGIMDKIKFSELCNENDITKQIDEEQYFNLLLKKEILIITEYKNDKRVTILNPQLKIDYLEFIRNAFLVQIISDLLPYEDTINSRLKFINRPEDKIKYIEKEINDVSAEIKTLKYPNLIQLYNSEVLEKGKKYQYWEEKIGSLLIFQELNLQKDGENKIPIEIQNYIKSRDFYYSGNEYGVTEWKKTETIIHKLNFLYEFKKVLTASEINSEKTNSENKNFLNSIQEILINKNSLLIIEEILKLNENKNIPFFTAFYNFFSGNEGTETKIFINNKPKVFIDIVNKTYNLNMKRLIPETGSRPNMLKELFSKIYFENKNL